MWRLIGFTPENSVKDEVERIIELLKGNIDYFHIRKPKFNEDETRSYILSFPLALRQKLTIHYFPKLALEYDLGGIHLNSRNPELKDEYLGKRISYSCHSLEEVKEKKEFCDYVFLSPIYNSISKEGYNSGFDLMELKKSKEIDEKVFALGGINEDKFEELKEIGFGGAGLLGSIWK